MKRTSIFILALALFGAFQLTAQNTLRMTSGQKLDKGQKIEVAGKGYLSMQADGNLVFYNASNQPKWATGTNGKTTTHAIMQTDGNLCIYNGPQWVWDAKSASSSTQGGYFEIDLNTLNVAIFTPSGAEAKVLQEGTKDMKFTNTGTKTVEIYKTDSQGLPIGTTPIATIGNLGSVTIQVKRYDQFLVKTPYIATSNIGTGVVNDLYSYHPKIVITDLNEPSINIMGNLPANEARGTGGLTYAIPDYEPNCSGIDLTVLNPRDLVSSINKAPVFEKLNPQSGVDYTTTGNKLIKYGFNWASMNTSSGSSDIKMAYGYNAFSKDFSVNVGGSVPVKGVEVSGSIGYNMTENSQNSDQSVYTYSREQSSVFKVTVEPVKARLTPEFINDVLSVQSVQDAYVKIVSKYGTHFPRTIIYGGDRSVYTVMTENQYSSAKSWGVDVKLEVSKSKQALDGSTSKYDANGGVAGTEYKYGAKSAGSGSLSFGYSQSETVKSLMQNTSSKYRLIGGSGGFNGWTVNEGNAAAISVEVGSLLDLIDIKVFKEGTNAAVLAQKKAWIEQAIAQHLQGLKFLNQPKPDPIVYTFTADKYKRTAAFWEDTNVGIKGKVYAAVWKEGETYGAQHNHVLWEKPDFSGDWSTYAFVQDKDYSFTKAHAVDNAKFTYVQYPEPDGTFKKLKFTFYGDFYEFDDLDAADQICGNSTMGQDTKAFLGTTAIGMDKTGTFDCLDNCSDPRQKINVTFKVKQLPSEFAGLAGN